ncbi:winged helix-turn-helix transcriptional regulator [Candidatus Woesearchaeota archaeon]|nr:winged helix-turn-helix transcriptional regulator [Candidatus Woesearchaeota archaeon]
MITKAILKDCRKEGFDEEEIYGAYKIFFGTLVSHPRLRIINLLRKGRKNVSEIVEGLGAKQTAVSHELARLKRCGFVDMEVDKKFRYYKLNEKTIKPLMGLIDAHMSKNCIRILRAEKK